MHILTSAAEAKMCNLTPSKQRRLRERFALVRVERAEDEKLREAEPGKSRFAAKGREKQGPAKGVVERGMVVIAARRAVNGRERVEFGLKAPGPDKGLKAAGGNPRRDLGVETGRVDPRPPIDNAAARPDEIR